MSVSASAPLKTLVEEYIEAALGRAITSELEDGGLEAHLDGFPGVRAYGDDRHQCYQALFRIALEWVHIWLSRGFDLPKYAGIDLNSDRRGILATFGTSAGLEMEKDKVYETEDELFAALDLLTSDVTA